LESCWGPSNSIGDALSLGVIGPYHVTLVGVHGQAKLPSINAMGCPATTYAGFFMNDDTGSGRSNGCAIEVKRSMDLCPGR